MTAEYGAQGKGKGMLFLKPDSGLHVSEGPIGQEGSCSSGIRDHAVARAVRPLCGIERALAASLVVSERCES